ncbi:MAG: zinc ribbon domain-containing protein [Armatimonadota bacterium]
MIAGLGEAFSTAIGVAVSLLIVSYPVYRVVSLLIEQEITFLEMVIYLSILGGFIIGIMTTWGSPLSLLLLGMLVVLSFGHTFVQRAVNKRKVWAMDQQTLEEADAAIERMPQNRRPYETAIRILRRRHDYEQAAEYIEKYLDNVGEDRAFERRLQILKRLIRQKTAGVKVCPNCGAENPAGTGTCIYCGHLMTLPSDFWAGCGTEIGVRAVGLTMATLLVAAIATTVFRAPQLISGVLYVGAFSTFLVYMYVKYR